MSTSCALKGIVNLNNVMAGCRKDAFENLFSYLGNKIPVSALVLYVCDVTTGVMCLYSVATDAGAVVCHQRRYLSNAAVDEYKKILPHDIYIFSISSSYVASEFLVDFPIPRPFSAMNVHTRLHKNVYACLGVCCNALEEYSEHHADVLQAEHKNLSLWLRDFTHRFEDRVRQTQWENEREAIIRRLDHLGKDCIVGSQTGLKKVLDMARRVSPLKSTVLITGETGSGKEVLANAIHRMSARFSGPFVSVNCGAIPETLLDSELFGYEQGAFTDAQKMRKGFFEQADGGSIFLDEIGELSQAAQVKLLRLLQTMEFYRVGGRHPLSVDVRVLAATNRDLDEMARQGLFRHDLLYRLNVYPIHVPPLKSRKSDIPALAYHFAKYKAREMAIAWKPKFAPVAIEQLEAYDWPGNVRELQNVIERKLILSQGAPLSFGDLTSPGGKAPSARGGAEKLTMADFPSLNTIIQNYIEEALAYTEGKIEGPDGAAHLLELPPSTLRAKMKKYGISR